MSVLLVSEAVLVGHLSFGFAVVGADADADADASLSVSLSVSLSALGRRELLVGGELWCGLRLSPRYFSFRSVHFSCIFMWYVYPPFSAKTAVDVWLRVSVRLLKDKTVNLIKNGT